MPTKKTIKASTIADFLGLALHGEDCSVLGVSSFASPAPNCMIFVEKATADAWSRISTLSEVLVFCDDEFGLSLQCATIWTDNPRLAFIRAVNHFFSDLSGPPFVPGVGPGSVVSPGATIGTNVSIGCHCVIGDGVEIGDHSVILNNVSISGSTVIGKRCFIKSGAVIGETGFGFVLDEEGRPVAMPHFGGILIGNDVSLGANSTVERGMFENTVIHDGVKVDDLVQIGHNVVVGIGTRIAAGTILCGAVRIGTQCWIAPNVTIRERLEVGSGAYIGLAANVIRNVSDNEIVVGNPARALDHVKP
jgi:UDP-3-O-[3-hydroxymyristoyl] glucosamine N-acyltransferase